MTEGCLVLLWWDHPDLAVEAMMIQLVDVDHGGVFDVLESMPRAVEMDEFRLVQPVEGFGERVVVAVAPRADRRDRAGLGEPLRVPDSEILHAAVGTMTEIVEWLMPARPQRHPPGVEAAS